MDQPVTVCVFWFREWCGDLGPTYVNRLAHAVCDNSTLMASGGEFVLFTDRPEAGFVPVVKPRRLSNFALGLKWNLVKMFMYSPEAGLEDRRVICLDLDMIITGDLGDILNYNGNFVVCEAAYHRNTYGGSVVGFAGGDKELEWRLWTPLTVDQKKIEKLTEGSERLWYREALAPIAQTVDLWQQILPGQIRSYKTECREGGPPAGARLVRFHGSPRPHEVSADWVKRSWGDADV